MADMTPEAIVDLCKKNGGYRQAHLNDQLYLQCKGFRQICNLEPYVNCKAIWLDQNAISEVENLGHLKELATLFLQDNNIRRLKSVSFEGLANLRILNLSNNNLSRLAGLQSCPLLETLQLSHNRFSTLESLRGMTVCQKLSSVDVSHNMIDTVGSAETEHENNNNDDNEKDNDADDENENGGGDDDGGARDPDNLEKDQQFLAVENSEKLVEFWKNLPELGVLYLHGNELPRRCKFYRKRMICGVSSLMYLDERPIFPDERRTTEAWGRGGNEAEDAERTAIREEKLAEMEKNVKSLMELKGARKEMREQAERERQVRMEEEKDWRNAMQIEWARHRTEVDHLEYEQRAYLEQEEENVFAKIFSVSALNASVEKAKLAREKRRLEEEVTKEIEEEERKMAEEMENHRKQLRLRHAEMKKAIDAFKHREVEDDDEYISRKKNNNNNNNNKSKSSKSKNADDDDDDAENEADNQTIEETLREEARAAFYQSLKPKSEQEVMTELFSNNTVAGNESSSHQQSKSSSKSATSVQTKQELELLKKVTAQMPSALQIIENVAKQLENGDDVTEESTASLLLVNNSTTTTAAATTASSSFQPTFTLPKKKRTGGNSQHWDAFLNMENRHGRKF